MGMALAGLAAPMAEKLLSGAGNEHGHSKGKAGRAQEHAAKGGGGDVAGKRSIWLDRDSGSLVMWLKLVLKSKRPPSKKRYKAKVKHVNALPH
ncbi:MAG: hypothetical protein EXR35_09630 [Limnohabitans sp.]|nr:hypothetical protein [Limnohabitans sp.]